MDLREILCEDVDWIHLAQHGIYWRALVNTAIFCIPDCCMMVLCAGYTIFACISSLFHVNFCVAMLQLLCKLYVAMQRPIKFVMLLSNG
jgi:hypothetical protein